jgi:hypothetical protein
VSAQATAARIGQGPVLAVILGAAAVVGFGIGTLIGSQDPRSPSGAPVASSALGSPTPTPAATPMPTASPSPSSSATARSSQPAATAAPPQEIILTLSGTEHDVSDPFEVISGWQIQWQTDGASLAIAVTGDQNLGVIVDEPGPASGVTSLAPAGTFRLDIAASGPWSITVVQGGG